MPRNRLNENYICPQQSPFLGYHAETIPLMSTAPAMPTFNSSHSLLCYGSHNIQQK